MKEVPEAIKKGLKECSLVDEKSRKKTMKSVKIDINKDVKAFCTENGFRVVFALNAKTKNSKESFNMWVKYLLPKINATSFSESYVDTKLFGIKDKLDKYHVGSFHIGV